MPTTPMTSFAASDTRRRRAVLATLSASILLVTACARVPPPSSHAERTSLRVMTWNIHHGVGMDGHLDIERIARTIREVQPDLVALQEVDRGVARTQGRDLPAELAALTELTPVFARNIRFQGGEYGNATLSRWPVLSSTNRHYRMLREGEQRGLLKVVVDVGGRPLAFWNTHIDHRRDDLERRSNVEEIRTFLATANLPVILAGDFNDFPDSPVYRGLSEALIDTWSVAGNGPGATFPDPVSPRRIDYVWVDRRAPLRAASANVLNSDASDHLPLVVEFDWPVDRATSGTDRVGHADSSPNGR